jgi:hypothetical protein
MLPLPSPLHPTRNPCSPALNPLSNILNPIADRLPNFARHAIDSFADAATCRPDNAANCVRYTGDGITDRVRIPLCV